MDPVIETKKRLNIAKKISSSLEGIVKGILLSGSMGFGQNYSVTKNSDIDMVIVCDKEKVRDIERVPYFNKQVPQNVLKMFEDGTINLFWVTKEVDSVEVNTFVYETEGYEKFCLLKGGIKGYIPTKPSETQTQHRFNGKEITFKRNVIPYDEGYLYEKPALVKGKYWGGVPRQDFFYSAYILFQEGGFLSDLEKNVWKTTIKQLIKEYGKHPKLNKVNILNTHYTYQKAKHKLPAQVIKKIQKRTKIELKNI